jgi:hypothetical protein
MRRFVAIASACLLAVGLAACSTSTTPASSAPVAPTAVATAVQTLLAADIAQMLQEANAATPPDIQAINCATFLQTNMNALNGQLGAMQKPAGILSALEAGNLALSNAANGLSPAMRTAAENACAPYAQHIVGNGLTVAQDIAAILAPLGVKIAVPATIPLPAI